MNAFTYVSVRSASSAIAEHAASSAYLAGGTNLLDDMKLGVERHAKLIDVNGVSGLDGISDLPDGGLRVGAAARVLARYPALSQAILAGASPQLRNAATTAGNLLQRTRCPYFRDAISPCNKREPGSGCAAIGGYNRSHAILGTSDLCIATHPSDMDVAMVALEAVVHVAGPSGTRAIPIGDFYVAYGDDPAKENTLSPGELITSVDLPATPWLARSAYVKARDRASYEFALASAAVCLDLDGETIRASRIALGGVATKPWRASAAEAVLLRADATDATFGLAADAALRGANVREHNGFKVELCRRVLVQALRTAAALKA
jgi:xanthine dehydrogenase YagS FAD-binding subunit